MLVMVLAGGMAMQAVAMALIAAGMQVVRAADLPMARRMAAQLPVGLIVTEGTGAGLVPVCVRSGAQVIVIGSGCDPGLMPHLLAVLRDAAAPGLVVDLARVALPAPEVPRAVVDDSEGIPDWADLVAELRAAVAKAAPVTPEGPAAFAEWVPGAAEVPQESLLAQTRVRRFAIVT